MKLQLLKTKDNSFTLYNPELDETYHSRHGALQESLYVFIKQGMQHCPGVKNNKELRILEIGFGTGLNAILTYLEMQKTKSRIHYTSLEPFPIPAELIAQLGYTELLELNNEQEKVFYALHAEKIVQTDDFHFELMQQGIMDLRPDQAYDLIYFDAFAPEKQPEIWSAAVFEKCFSLLNSKGILVTYCAKGEVKRTLKATGFQVQTLPGPPGKREMVRATKTTYS